MIYVSIVRKQLKIGFSESFWEMFIFNLLQYLKSLTKFFFYNKSINTNSYSNNKNYLKTKIRNICIIFKAYIYLFTTYCFIFRYFVTNSGHHFSSLELPGNSCGSFNFR